MSKQGRSEIWVFLLITGILVVSLVGLTGCLAPAPSPAAPSPSPKPAPSTPEPTSTFASPPAYSWCKTFGGKDDDYAWSVKQTSDGGYVLAGYGPNYLG